MKKIKFSINNIVCTFVLLIFMNNYSSAQFNINYQTSPNSSLVAGHNTLEDDGSGNVISGYSGHLIGYSQSIDFLIYVDITGVVIFNKQFAEPGVTLNMKAIAKTSYNGVTVDGFIVVSDYYDFNTANSHPRYTHGILVYKVDLSGNLVWSQRFFDTDKSNYPTAYSIIESNVTSDNYIIAGNYFDSTNNVSQLMAMSIDVSS